MKKDRAPTARNTAGASAARLRIQRLTADGMLCAAGIVGRIALTALPNIQPVTAILILMAAYIGTWDAVVSAVVIVLVTNLYMGMGIWTVYQIVAWVAIALLSALFFHKKQNPWLMLGWAVLSGFIYGAVISTMSCRMLYDNGGGIGVYVAYWLSGLLFDAYHAIGNAVFIWFLQPLFKRIIKKPPINQA